MNQIFNKGSGEWNMFMDYWKFVQKYYIPEENDEYWDELVDASHNLFEKYKSVELSEYLINGFLDYINNKAISRRKNVQE